MVLVTGAPMYTRWARLMGELRWLEDERFQTDDSRGEHAEVFTERMARWCSERTTKQALAELEAARVPAGPVFSPQEALDAPEVREAGFLQDVQYPGAPTDAPLVTTPVRLVNTPGTIRFRAPQLGEHTYEILRELGYADEAIDRFRALNIV